MKIHKGTGHSKNKPRCPAVWNLCVARLDKAHTYCQAFCRHSDTPQLVFIGLPGSKVPQDTNPRLCSCGAIRRLKHQGNPRSVSRFFDMALFWQGEWGIDSVGYLWADRWRGFFCHLHTQDELGRVSTAQTKKDRIKEE